MKHRNGPDWHRITFWASFGVAVVFMIAAPGIKKYGWVMPWSEQGRYMIHHIAAVTFGWPIPRPPGAYYVQYPPPVAPKQ